MNSRKPNRIKHRILGRLLRPSVRESALLDFDDQFDRIRRDKGTLIAILWFGIQAIFLIPSAVKDYLYWSGLMLRNYLTIVLRTIRRHKGYSFINIAGLAIGMACTLLILLWIQDELSYDRFHAKGDNIYRIIVENDQGLRSAGTCPIPLSPRLKQAYPEILDSSRLFGGFQESLVECDNRVFSEKIGIVDPTFFTMFTFPFSKGDPQTALDDPFSLLMTEKMARKYFGLQEPLGKTLVIQSSRREKTSFQVTGILKDIPHNSHLQFQIFVPFQSLNKLIWWANDFEKWSDWSYFTYILTKPGTSIPELNKKITDLVRQNDKDDLTSHFFLQPLAGIHLHSDFRYDLAGHGDILTVRIFAAVALFILLIACVNFMNLSTARFHNRSKEVGLRKTVGAHRMQIIKQFLGESLVFVLFAFLAALVLMKFTLPLLNRLTGKPLAMNLENPGFLTSLIAVIFFTALVSGSYPAFFLSAFQPANVLKGTSKALTKGNFFRKFLVVLQFSLSIVIIICTAVVADQLAFLQKKKLGFHKDNVIHLPMDGTLRQSYETVRNELLQYPDIKGVAASDQLLTQILRSSTGARLEGQEVCKDIGINLLTVDIPFLRTLEMKMSQGRPFSEDFLSDSSQAVIINRALTRTIGEENLIGKAIRNYNDGRTRQIIGIVEDFHFESLHHPVKPLMIVPKSNSEYKFMYVRIEPGTISSCIPILEDVWKKYGSGNPFTYHFLDQTIDRLYASENRMGKIFLAFAFLAIFISCLGLFGLASYSAEQRTKEIGIRKVLGATARNIFTAMTINFARWVLAANIIAWPIAYFAMQEWLRNFAFKTEIGLWVFILSAGLSLVTALTTVGYQSLKAALANPTESLRHE